MSYTKWLLIVRISAFIGLIFLAFGRINSEHPLSFLSLILGVSILVIGLIMSAVKLKCSYCGTRIPDMLTVVKFKKCPNCGKEIK